MTFAQSSERHRNDILLVSRDGCEKSDRLNFLRGELEKRLPRPVKNITNAALRCKEDGVGEDAIGAYEMSGSHIKISARGFMRVLSGEISFEEWEKSHEWPENPFKLRALQGRGIIKAELIRQDDEDDDWLVFRFGSQDAAMAPFTPRPTSEESE
jgi:hypothetical protein